MRREDVHGGLARVLLLSLPIQELIAALLVFCLFRVFNLDQGRFSERNLFFQLSFHLLTDSDFLTDENFERAIFCFYMVLPFDFPAIKEMLTFNVIYLDLIDLIAHRFDTI